MNYTHMPTGGLRFGGCASPIKVTLNYEPKFGSYTESYVFKSGDQSKLAKAKDRLARLEALSTDDNGRLYRIDKAEVGRLESVCIKKVRRVFPYPPCPYGIQPDYTYQDTTNRIWMEHELALKADAIALAIAYWEYAIPVLEEELRNC